MWFSACNVKDVTGWDYARRNRASGFPIPDEAGGRWRGLQLVFEMIL